MSQKALWLQFIPLTASLQSESGMPRRTKGRRREI